VRVIGGRARQVNVVVDSNRLSGLDLTVADVVRALQTQNVQVPGGKVEQGVKDLTLRTYGRVSTPGELGRSRSPCATARRFASPTWRRSATPRPRSRRSRA